MGFFFSGLVFWGDRQVFWFENANFVWVIKKSNVFIDGLKDPTLATEFPIFCLKAEIVVLILYSYHTSSFPFSFWSWFSYHGSWFALFGTSTVKKIHSRKELFMEILLKFFGPHFLVESWCSLLLPHCFIIKIIVSLLKMMYIRPWTVFESAIMGRKFFVC